MPARKQILGLFFHISLLFLAALLAQRANYSKSQPELMRVLYQSQQRNAIELEVIFDNLLQKIKESCRKAPNWIPIWESAAKIRPIRNKFVAVVDSNITQIIKNPRYNISVANNEINQAFLAARIELIDLLTATKNTKINGVIFDSIAFKTHIASLLLDTVDYPNLRNKDEAITAFSAQKMRLSNNAFNALFYLGGNLINGIWHENFEIHSQTNNQFIYLNDSFSTEINILFSHSLFLEAHTDKGNLSGEKYIDAFRRITYKNRPDKIGTQYYTITFIYEHPDDFRIVDTISQTFSYEVLPAVSLQTKALPPKPVPSLAELRGGDITREKLSFPITLQAEEEHETVLSFTLWHLQKGEEPKPYKINADKIPAHILAEIQAGDQLQFVDIRGREKRDLPTMAFVVR